MVMPLLQNVVWVLFIALGVRLVVVGVRENSVAERWLGVALVLSGPGAGLLRYGVQTQTPYLTTLGIAMISLGGSCTLVFAYLVFRPGEVWARYLLAALIGSYAVGFWHQVEVVGIWGGSSGRPSFVLLAARAVGLGWCAYESLRYRRMYVKRLALGLADPVIANRFLLYAIWTGALAALPAFVGVVAAIYTDTETWRAAFLLPTRIVGVVVFVSMVLIFVPPKVYTDLIERRYERRTAGAAP